MNPFVRFMTSPAGRVTRVVGATIVIGSGLIAVGGTSGVVLAAVGIVPLAASLFDICVFAPLFQLPFSGARIRAVR
jgi:hypothetical protein